MERLKRHTEAEGMPTMGAGSIHGMHGVGQRLVTNSLFLIIGHLLVSFAVTRNLL